MVAKCRSAAEVCGSRLPNRRDYFGLSASVFGTVLVSLDALESFGGGLSPRVDMRSSVLTLSPSVELFVEAAFFGFAAGFFGGLFVVWSC